MNASNLASGTIPDARFPSALPAVDGSNLTGINTDLVADTTPQLGGDLASNGNNINIADDDNINFGNGSDLTIRHQASNNTSYIEETGSGHLVIKGDDTFIQNAAGTTNIAKFTDGGGVNLYHNSNTPTFQTTTTGATITGNLTTTGTITPGTYRSGEVIEEISSTCDGSTVVVQSGSYTMTNVTGVQNGSTTYTTVTGSSISYTPPAGTKRVYYRFWYHYDVTENSGISHHIMQIDGTEVYGSANNVASNYASSNWHHACFPISVEYTIDCDASSTNANAGQFTSWTSAKTLRVQYREYNSSYESRLHYNTWWNGGSSSGNYTIMKPHLTIRAIA